MAADENDTATSPLFIECLLEDWWPLLNVEKINECSHTVTRDMLSYIWAVL